jgi:hypothetical protein
VVFLAVNLQQVSVEVSQMIRILPTKGIEASGAEGPAFGSPGVWRSSG